MDFKLLKFKFKLLKIFFSFIALYFCIPYAFTIENLPRIKTTEKNQNFKSDKSSEQFYYFTLSEQEKPVFTQILKWSDSNAVLRYEVTLKTEKDKIIFEKLLATKNELEVNLKPGKYFYKVYAYNMLGTIEKESDWIEVKVKKATLPQIETITPKVFFIEDFDKKLEITGSGFKDTSAVFLVLDNGRTFEELSVEKITNTKILLNLKNAIRTLGGNYRIKVVDESGLFATSEPITFKTKKLYDFYFGLGFVPFFLIHKDFQNNDRITQSYFSGGVAELGAIFFKKEKSFFGLELRTSFKFYELKNNFATWRTSDILISSLFLYEYHFAQTMNVSLKAGAGLSINKIANALNQSSQKLAPQYAIKVSLKTKPRKYFYFDVGACFEQVLRPKSNTIYIAPEFVLGFRF